MGYQSAGFKTGFVRDAVWDIQGLVVHKAGGLGFTGYPVKVIIRSSRLAGQQQRKIMKPGRGVCMIQGVQYHVYRWQ